MNAGGSSGNETVAIYTRNYQSNSDPVLICTLNSESYYGTSGGVTGRSNVNNVITYNDMIYLVWVVAAAGGTGNTIRNSNWKVGILSIDSTGSYASVAQWSGSTDATWWWYGSFPKVGVSLTNAILSILVVPDFSGTSGTRDSNYQIRLFKVELDTSSAISGILSELVTSTLVPDVGFQFSDSGLAVSADIFAVYSNDTMSTNSIYTSTAYTALASVSTNLAEHGFLFKARSSSSSTLYLVSDNNGDFTFTEGQGDLSNVVRYFSAKFQTGYDNYRWYALKIDNTYSALLYVSREISILDMQTGEILAASTYQCKYLIAQTVLDQNKLYICVDRGDGTEDRYLVNA